MAWDRPAGESKPTPEEGYEVRLRQTLEDVLPLMLEGMRQDEEAMIRQGSADPAMLEPEDIIHLKDRVAFLRGLNPHALEGRIIREWQSGDDRLMVSFMTLWTIRAHLAMQRIEGAMQEGKAAGTIPLGEKPDAMIQGLRRSRTEVDAVLSWLLSRSRVFGETYQSQDLLGWIQNREESLRGQPKPGGIAGEYSFLTRILSGPTQGGDREALRALIDREMSGDLMPMEGLLIGALRDEPEVREDLRRGTQSLLKLYQIRPFVDALIPERPGL